MPPVADPSTNCLLLSTENIRVATLGAKASLPSPALSSHLALLPVPLLACVRIKPLVSQ